MSSVKWHPFCLGLNVLIQTVIISYQITPNDAKDTSETKCWLAKLKTSHFIISDMEDGGGQHGMNELCLK